VRTCILGKADVPVCNLAQYLVENGHEVHLVMALEEESPPIGVIPHRLEVRHKLDFFLSARKVCRIIERIRPDVVHAFYLTSYGYLASRIPAVPVLATSMGTDIFGAPELSRILAPLRTTLVRQAIRRADHLHSVAPAMSKRLIDLGADPTRISTFPRGVSLTRFTTPAERPTSGVCRILCNRRLEPVYDHATLLQAAARLSERGIDYRLEIVGQGALRQRLEALASELSLERRVAFRGNKPHREMPTILNRSDVFVSASLSDGTSSSLLEAMASGCLPVVSDIPANRLWVHDGVNGFLFQPGDPRSLARAIERSIGVRSRWAEIGHANRERIRAEASLERGCERVLELYRDLIGRTEITPETTTYLRPAE